MPSLDEDQHEDLGIESPPYAPNDGGWYKGLDDAANNTSPAGGFSPPSIGSGGQLGADAEKAGNPLDPEKLKSAENKIKPDAGQGAGLLAGETGKDGKPLYTGKGGGLKKALNGRQPGTLGVAVSLINSRRGTSAAVAAGLGTVLFGILATAGGSSYMIQLKQQAIGKGNRFARLRNTSFEKRRAKSQATKLAKAAAVTGGNPTFLDNFAEKLASEELKLAKDEAGKILGVADQQGKLLVEFENGYPKKGFAKFLESEAGAEFKNKLDNIAPSIADEWRGVAAKKNFLERFKISFKNIFNRGPPEEGESFRDQIDEGLRQADEIDDVAKIEGQQPISDIQDSATEGEGNAGKKADEIFDSATQDQAENFKTQLAENADEAVDALEGSANEILAEVGEDTAKATVLSPSASDSLFKVILGKVGSVLARRPAQIAFKALDIAAVPQTACKVKGTINFLVQIKSVMLAMEVAKFFIRVMVTPDEQMAGMVHSSTVKLASMETAGVTSTGSWKWLSGDHSAKVTQTGLAKYSVGRRPTGVLGAIYSFANKFPGTSADVCSFLNNGLVQIGTMAVGIIVAVFGGAESGFTEGNGLTVAALQVARDVAFAIATPILVRTISRQVMTAVKDYMSVGDALVAGAGAAAASNGSVNGARISTIAQATYLDLEAKRDERIEVAQTSIFDRYFNTKNEMSLANKLAMKLPMGLKGYTDAFVNGTQASVASIFAPASVAQRAFTATAYADTIGSDQCTDETLNNLNVVTDPFCNPLVASIPNLDLQNTEEALRSSGFIDQNGQPVKGSEFEKYINNCLSGRFALLSPEEISTDGNNDPFDDTCIKQGDPLAVDKPETIYAMRDIGKPSLLDRITGNARAFAAPEDETRIPGRYERFTVWYGYLVDSKNTDQNIYNDFSDNDYLEGDTGGVGSGTVVGSDNPTTIIEGDTTNIACGAGTDIGTADGYRDGKLYKIRLCNVQRFTVNSQISKKFDEMLTAASADGINFFVSGFSGAFRSMEGQIATYQQHCRADGIAGSQPPFPKDPGQTIRCPGGGAPGYSNHQMGLAADLGCNATNQGIPRSYADASTNPCWKWLNENAATYGIYEYGKGKPESRSSSGYEGWHWSVDGN